jgi:hypothetical protein
MQGFALLTINDLHLVAVEKNPKIATFMSIKFEIKADLTVV